MVLGVLRSAPVGEECGRSCSCDPDCRLEVNRFDRTSWFGALVNGDSSGLGRCGCEGSCGAETGKQDKAPAMMLLLQVNSSDSILACAHILCRASLPVSPICGACNLKSSIVRS